MNFENTRTCEMLDSASASGDSKRKRIALAAATLGALQASIAQFAGQEILSERGEEVRIAFSTLGKILILEVCETPEDVRTFQAVEEALFSDLADLRKKRDN